MQTIKTAVVVVLLLFVLYGGYTALIGTDTQLNPDLEKELLSVESLPDISSGPFVSSKGASSANSFESFNSTPTPGFGSSSAPSPFGQSSPTASTPASVPPLALPDLTPPVPSASSNSGPTPLPLLTPSEPKTAPSGGISFPPLPPLDENASPSEANPKIDESTTISTNTPSFGIGSSSPKIPADLASNSNTIPALELPSNLPDSPDINSDPVTSLPASSSVKPNSASKSYQNAKDLALSQIDRGELRDALATLSVFYNAAELTTDQRQDMLDLLDALAREVVYSRRHLLDIAHVVAPGDSLEQIAKQSQVPAEILARINAIDPTSPLPNGRQIKVVPGPFRAEVDLTRNELTIFVGDLYAGRYPVSIGADPSPQVGPYQVIDKRKDRNYYGNGTQMIAANDPRNPYGGWWIDLGQDVCIHGSPAGDAEDNKLGCISLSPVDASDVYAMLGRGSQVTIRK